MFCQGSRYGRRSDSSSEVPQQSVFKPLTAYREHRNAKEGIAVSGVFRTLSEDGPTEATHSLTTTKIYIRPSEETERIETVVKKQLENRHSAASSEVPKKLEILGNKDSKTNLIKGNTGGTRKPACRSTISEPSEQNDIRKLRSSESKRGESEPSGDSAQHTFPAAGSASETLAGNRTSYVKLESASTASSKEEHQGMHCGARDTGQQRGFGSSGVTGLSRPSSPETNSSSGSSYNISSTTEATGDVRGLGATPMGSTTGLLPDNTSSCSQSKLKVSTDFAVSLTLLCDTRRQLDYK
jgi:hypothetical protein